MKLDQQTIDQLASEYALGTLRGPARRRFEALLREDAQARRAVAQWQDRLAPMALMSAPVEPPANVWQAIAERTIGRQATPAASLASARRPAEGGAGLRFWRMLGIGSSALAAVLLGLVIAGRPALQPDAGAPVWVAVVADKAAAPVLVATSTGSGETRIRLLQRPAVGPDKSLELWAVPAQGKPRSLGLLDQGERTLRLARESLPGQAPVLAISVEPRGGSTNPDGPSGPVILSGKWLPA